MMRNIFKNQKGFTLVEIICAIAILGIVAVPTYSIFVGASKGQTGSGSKLMANNVAQSVMEEILKTGTYNASSYSDFDIEVLVETPSPSESTEAFSTTVPVYVFTTSAPSTTSPTTTPTTIPTASPTPTPTTPATTSGPSDNPGFIDYDPGSNYNARIGLFDYIDEDLYILGKTGAYLIFGSTSKFDAFLADPTSYKNWKTFSSNYSYISNYKMIEKYDANTLKSVLGLSDFEYTRMVACYEGMPLDVAVQYETLFVERYKTMYDNIISQLSSLVNSTVEAEKISYITSSSNMFKTIDYLYNNMDTDPYFIKPSGFTDTHNDYPNLKIYIRNIYNLMYTKVINSSKRGPYLIVKVFDNNGNLAKVGSKYVISNLSPTDLTTYGSSIVMDLYQNYLGFWGLVNYTWATAAENTLGIKLKDLKQATVYPWYHYNMYYDMTFYVTGTLCYRDTNFAIRATANYTTFYYDDNNVKQNYIANMNFFQKLSCGNDKLTIIKWGDFSWLKFNGTVSDIINSASPTPAQTTSPTATSAATSSPAATALPGTVDTSTGTYVLKYVTLSSLSGQWEKITVKVYKKGTTKLLAMLVTYRSTAGGISTSSSLTSATATPSSQTTVSPSATVAAATASPTVAPTQNTSVANITFNLNDSAANNYVTYTSTTKGGTVNVSSINRWTNPSMSFWSGYGFGFYNMGYSGTADDSTLGLEYYTGCSWAKPIKELTIKFEGSLTNYPLTFTMNLSGSGISINSTTCKTNIVIYNNLSNLTIVVNKNSVDWLTNGTVTVVDKNGNSTTY
ncbi:MAG: type II secretion system GspH family protein [Clostridia bacterium]|nr:type II secretion system GspH family protein [Clostridia bacterium]